MQSSNHKSSGGIVDLFCGVGGLSLGFKKAGFRIAAGVDLDAAGRYAYQRYTGGRFIHDDIRNVAPSTIKKLLGNAKPSILIGCAPCQSFSEYNKRGRGRSWNLLPTFAKIIEKVRPDIVSMENVARLATYKEGSTLDAFIRRLSRAGYDVVYYIVSSANYGVSQRRKRLVLFASRKGFIELIKPTTGRHKTLKQVIRGLPPLKAGSTNRQDRYHRAQWLSDANSNRIAVLREGGTWRDWPKKLMLECHKTKRGKEFGSVYGRLKWNEIGPTVTTQFYKVGTGRFAHPSQCRALSLREGAILQTFPRSFQFVDPNEGLAFDRVGRLIGNAVPVRLAEAIAKSIKRHIGEAF